MTQDQIDAVSEAVGLANKENIVLERIPWDVPPADQPRLKGAFAGHFGGFLQQDFREYDFAVGRREARDWLLKWLSMQRATLGLTNPAEMLLPSDVPTPPPFQIEPQWRSVAPGRQRRISTSAVIRVLVLLERWFGGAASWVSLIVGAALFAIVSAAAYLVQSRAWHPLVVGGIAGLVFIVATVATRWWLGRIAQRDGPTGPGK